VFRRYGAGAVKYRYTITHRGYVDADTAAQATALALSCFMEYEACELELEPLTPATQHVNERGDTDDAR
jgi:hypothetical protein